MTTTEFKAEVAALFVTGVRKGISAADLRQAFNDLVDIVNGVSESVVPSGPKFTPLNDVTTLTGGDDTSLDHAIPDGAQAGDYFAISPPAGIADIGLAAEQQATYKLRLKNDGEVTNGTSKVQPVNAGLTDYLLFRIQ